MPKILANVIERSLCERIASGEWSASGRLPSERDLAAEYGVARNTLRRAIEKIASRGTVERHIARGAFLNNETSEIGRILQRVTGASPADLIGIRLVIEPQAAAVAAKNANRCDLQGITEAYYHASKSLRPDQFDYWDSKLHRRLFAATRNELLVNIHAMLQSIPSWQALIALKRRKFSEDRLEYCAQQMSIVAALNNRDAGAAAQAMLQHIKAIEVAVFGSARKLVSPP